MKKRTVSFNAIILQFGKQGEKTGWRYIEIEALLAQQLFPGNKKTFRISGTIDRFPLEKASLIPMGGGKFILPFNASIRKGTRKNTGQTVVCSFWHDTGELELDKDLLDCLEEDSTAKNFFYKLTPGHRNYFSKWISSAKTDATKAKRIALSLDALVKKMDFGAMLRAQKGK